MYNILHVHWERASPSKGCGPWASQHHGPGDIPLGLLVGVFLPRRLVPLLPLHDRSQFLLRPPQSSLHIAYGLVL